ncbi:MAG: hypothetical protein KDK70_25595 [Myxococcales bacterium]|nr:hypothetical protein [Myxococcales bacterium]
MDRRPLRLRALPLHAVLLLSVGCAGGDSVTSATFGPGNTLGPATTDTESTGQVTTFEPDTGMMTGGATEDTGRPDTGTDTGPDPDTGSDTGCAPEPEVCDGMDNDCNGMVDDGNPGGGEDCDTGLPSVCAAGQTACEGGSVVCNAIEMGTPEVCDNVDNDCNGMVDDGNPGGGAACNTGMPGVCAVGTNACQGGSVVCVPNETASAETCDGEDDDCNGVVDNGNPGGGGACVTGQPGICSAGTNTCTGGSIVCQQNTMAAPDEVCGNGLDDDCNGSVDDGCGGMCPFGLCESPGMPQTLGCDPCVDQVCAADAFCCSNQWDSICVGEVESVCMRADCIDPACAHLVCVEGAALAMACHPCVTTVCGSDAFCCSNTWDSICVDEVGSLCMLACPP